MNNAIPNKAQPIILSFLQPYPTHLYPEDSDECVDNFSSLDEMSAALFRRLPTSVSTPGKMRPGGFSRTGKFLPAKWIPAKIDKRSGK